MRSRAGGQIEMGAAEIRRDLILGQMHRRRDDMRGHLAAKLDDIFAEIGLDRRDAVGLERGVEADLFADHRLAFGDAVRAVAAADIEHDIIGGLGRARVMHDAARLLDLLLIGFEIEIEMRERMRLDIARLVAQGLEFRQARDGFGALGDKAVADEMQRLLQLRVCERLMRIVAELRRGRRKAHVGESGVMAGFAGPAQIAGASVMPASTSAKWRTSMRAALARQPAGHVHQAAEIAGKQDRGAAGFDIGDLLIDDGGGDLAVFHREGAAEAAAAVADPPFRRDRARGRS